MEHLLIIKNQNFSSFMNLLHPVVCVANADETDHKFFAGSPDLKENFELFMQLATDKTTYDEAVNFFTPQIKIVI